MSDTMNELAQSLQKRYRFTFHAGLFFLIVLLMNQCRMRTSEVMPEVVAGRIDLTNFEFQNQPLALSGDWKLRWNEFVKPDQDIKDAVLVPVPSHWMKYTKAVTSVQGRATFQAEVDLPESVLPLALHIPAMDTAFVLYWNGEEIARNANIYKESGQVFPLYYAPVVRSLPVKPGLNRITLHLVNSIYPRPGFRDNLVLGLEAELRSNEERSLLLDVFLAGSLFIIALYHAGLFVLRPKDLSTFYFAWFAFVISIRLAVTGEAFLFRLTPITWKISTFLEYLTFYSAAPPLILFIRELFPDDGNRIFDRITTLLPVPFILLVIFFPLQIYSQSLVLFQLTTLVAVVYYVYILVRATIERRQTAWAFVAGSLAFFVTYFNDALYSVRLIDSVFLVPIGLFIFFFAQAFLLSQRFAIAFQTAETLTNELDQKVKERTRDLQIERDRSDDLLRNILPEKVAQELKTHNKVEPTFYPAVTVLFVDFVDFTHYSELMKPADLVSELDHCFRAFDEISERNGIEKLKTIGDSYMAVSGVPVSVPDHVFRCCEAALEIKSWMDNYISRKNREGRPVWSYRIGIHTGPVISGVIGSKKFAFDVWGDSVNVASRMESLAEPGSINISEAVYNTVSSVMECESRGSIEAKGKGQLKMYKLVSRKGS